MYKQSHYSTADLTATEREAIAKEIEDLIFLLWPDEMVAPGLAHQWLARIEAPSANLTSPDEIEAPSSSYSYWLHDAYTMSATAHRAQATMEIERPRVQLYPLCPPGEDEP